MKRLLLLVLMIAAPVFCSAEVFEIQDIRIDGLQRVSAGTVFASLPVGVGDLVDNNAIRNASRALFRTGYFDDIKMGRDGNVLVIVLRERPAISVISIEGNKSIETDQLLQALRENGLAEGQILREAILESMSQELRRQYVAQGRYGAKVETKVEDLPSNRVSIHIDVEEGSVAKIKHINIVGNQSFPEDDLLSNFELKTSGLFSFFSSSDKYSKEKLSGDLERLESWYLDRGYLKFSIDSTQVSVSPDKESVYITINVTEGDIYTVGEVDFAGDPILSEDELQRLVLLKQSETFSQVLMTSSSEFMTKRLGNEGYTFAEVKGYPRLNDEEKTADVTFFINPGKRAYVRRIEFRGNTKTMDEVLRREMRQMEGASASTALIEHSKLRLERLGFFKEVESEIRPVAGTSDQLDVVYTVEEQPSGSIGASVGFSQGYGLVLGANLQENNFMGTGKRVGIGINNSEYRTTLSFNYTDPYFTKDGVSAGFNIYFRETDYDEANLSNYTTDSFGLSTNFGYPLSENERLGFGFGYEKLTIDTHKGRIDFVGDTSGLYYDYFTDSQAELIENNGTVNYFDLNDNQTYDPPAEETLSSREIDAPYLASEIQRFLDEQGDNYDIFTLDLSWVKSTLNRGIFATRGARQRFGFEVTVPGSDIEYYRASYETEYYRPITKSLTLKLHGDLGYADGFGDTDRLPFFKNYYAGGFGSVRGFQRNTLGPRETQPCLAGGQPFQYYKEQCRTIDDDDPIGGNVLITGGVELLFPLPFIKDQRSVQTSVFLDVGNVFDTDCGSKEEDNCSEPELSELRYSIGIGGTWLSGFGPLTFSLAKPLNKNSLDEEEVFQFSLGQTF